ncbi:DUF550 domain-containing protein [Salmonella enterica]|nr:DUF550 domain-containing protein [Salmonella enterica]
MTTITRERLKQIYAECEERDPAIFEIRELVRIALASLEAEPVAYNQVQRDMMKDIIVRKMGGNLAGEKLVMDDIHAVTMALIDAGFRTAQPASEREQIRREHAEWSDATFGDVGPIGPLKHLSKEALEAAAEPDDLSEWADMQFLLWDAQRRAGITDKQITWAMVEKLEVNKKREWPEPKDGEPRLHIKEQPAPVVPESISVRQAIYALESADCVTTIAQAYKMGWNACRAAMLQSKYRDLSQPVDPQISEYEKIMQRAGWVMVPVEPTDEMIEAAMNCEDVLFNSDESFCVQFGNIYEAMLAAAPQPEQR